MDPFGEHGVSSITMGMLRCDRHRTVVLVRVVFECFVCSSHKVATNVFIVTTL